MGINRYLVNPREKEYMHFGKIGPVISETFAALQSDDIDVDTIVEFVETCVKWSDDTDPKFINMIGMLIELMAIEAGSELILIGDDIYSDMTGHVGIIDELLDNKSEFADWYGKTGETRARHSWYCKFDLYEFDMEPEFDNLNGLWRPDGE